jgi:hypothetical protein
MHWKGITMKKLSAVVVILLLTSSFSFAQQKHVGWSLGYYCGWDQGGFPPSSINWKAFSHISHFTLFPNNDGSLDSGNGVGGQNSRAAVAAAHQNGVKIVICIGGAGVLDRFSSACTPANIHKFVSNLLKFMRAYGYDGIDTDWEENYNDAEFTAWHKELKDSLNAINALGGPHKSLTIAGGGYFASHCAPAAPYVEQMNDMSYDVPLSNEPNRIKQFTDRGVPKSILGVGIGIGTGGGMVDGNAAAWTGKADYSINNGLGGIMEWAVKGGTLQTACYNALAPYVVHVSTLVLAGNQIAFENAGSLFIKSNGMTGMHEICYSVPQENSGNSIDLCVYDIKGALVKTLVHGPAAAGTFSVPFAQIAAGAYVVKLSTNSRTEATKAFIVR